MACDYSSPSHRLPLWVLLTAERRSRELCEGGGWSERYSTQNTRAAQPGSPRGLGDFIVRFWGDFIVSFRGGFNVDFGGGFILSFEGNFYCQFLGEKEIVSGFVA